MIDKKIIEKEYVCFHCKKSFKSTHRFNKPYGRNVCCGYRCYHDAEYASRSAERGAIYEKKNGINVLYECSCLTEKKEYHHFDYSKQKDVIKLCRSCHKKEHNRLRKLLM